MARRVWLLCPSVDRRGEAGEELHLSSVIAIETVGAERNSGSR
jgi:hypothetical protein